MTMTANVLILDFDGPLFSDRVIRHHPDNRTNHPNFQRLYEIMQENGDTFGASILTYWKMDEVAVGMLNSLMEIEPFETVISSSWREFCSRETIEYMFFLNNLKLKLHRDWCTDLRPQGHTYGSREYHDRLSEVHRWIERHKDEIKDYVIVDDPGSGGSLIHDGHVTSVGLNPKNVVICNYEVGLELDHYETMKEILLK
jgi:hypothetical protein